MSDLSSPNRSVILGRLQQESFDVLIIGGGITGAGIALDASSRGLKTALVEKKDFAYGTSSRSTKLIHGGLRYLKQLEFGLVKEVGSERAVVHKLAPHLVIPEKMLLPLSEKKGLGYWLTSIGLKIYDWLAGVKPEDQRKMLTRQQTLKHEPLLKDQGIKGGALYAEYRTDDARLTMEIVKASVRHGAVVGNYLKVTEFIYDRERVRGVRVTEELTGASFVITAAAIVNAAGPWVDDLRDINHSKTGKRLHLTKGVHVVVPRDKLAVRQAIYFDVDDGRMIFAIPRGRTTYIGTTDTNYQGDIDNVRADAADAQYLVKAINATFSSVHLTVNDIESSWAGLRPLIHEEGKSASELSRKDEIFESSTGLISIAGGKLTGYRKMAERVVDLVIRKYFADRSFKKVMTDKIPLGVTPFRHYKEVLNYTKTTAGFLTQQGLSTTAAQYLVSNYGMEAEIILKYFSTGDNNDPADLRLIKAELRFALENEMVQTVCDFFVRRTGLLYFDIEKVRRYKAVITAEMANYFNWNATRTSKERDELDKVIREATDFA